MCTGHNDQISTCMLNSHIERMPKSEFLWRNIHYLHLKAISFFLSAICRARIHQNNLNIFNRLFGNSGQQTADVFFLVVSSYDDGTNWL